MTPYDVADTDNAAMVYNLIFLTIAQKALQTLGFFSEI